MTETTTRPSADVAARILRDRLVVVAGAVEQLPEDSPIRDTLTCIRDTYGQAMAQLSRDGVAETVEQYRYGYRVFSAVGMPCCRVGYADVVSALGG